MILWPLSTSTTIWPVTPVPDDVDDEEKEERKETSCLSAAFPTTNHT
jgi:hypothetical protein